MNSGTSHKTPIVNYFFWTLLIIFLISGFVSLAAETIRNLNNIGSVRISRTILLVIIGAVGFDFIRNRQKWFQAPAWKVMAHTCLAVVLMVILGFLTSFEGPRRSRNENPVFGKHAPASTEYQNELLKTFARLGTENLYYLFKEYREVQGRHYLIAEVIGKDFVAEFPIDITDSKHETITNLIKVKGQSYGRVEIQGLKFDLNRTQGEAKYVLRDIERFAD